jgi:hypothetical protein
MADLKAILDNGIAPQQANTGAPSGPVKATDILLTAIADTYVVVSADGLWTDGSQPAFGKGHFMAGGTLPAQLILRGVNPTHKLGSSSGPVHVSALK